MLKVISPLVRRAAIEKLTQIEAGGYRFLLVAPSSRGRNEFSAVYARNDFNATNFRGLGTEAIRAEAPQTEDVITIKPRTLSSYAGSWSDITFHEVTSDTAPYIAAQLIAQAWSVESLAYDAEWLHRFALTGDEILRRTGGAQRVAFLLQEHIHSRATIALSDARTNEKLAKNLRDVRIECASILALEGVARAIKQEAGLAEAFKNPYRFCSPNMVVRFYDIVFGVPPDQNGTAIRAAISAAGEVQIVRKGDVDTPQRKSDALLSLKALGNAAMWGRGLPTAIAAPIPTREECIDALSMLKPSTARQPMLNRERRSEATAESGPEDDFLL